MAGSYLKISLVIQTKLQLIFGVDTSGCSRVEALLNVRVCVCARAASPLSLLKELFCCH